VAARIPLSGANAAGRAGILASLRIDINRQHRSAPERPRAFLPADDGDREPASRERIDDLEERFRALEAAQARTPSPAGPRVSEEVEARFRELEERERRSR
jgi:hypothetical protein